MVNYSWLWKQNKFKFWHFWFVQNSVGCSFLIEKMMFAQICIKECLDFCGDVYIQKVLPYVVNKKEDHKRTLHKRTCGVILSCWRYLHSSVLTSITWKYMGYAFGVWYYLSSWHDILRNRVGLFLSWRETLHSSIGCHLHGTIFW